MAMKLKILTDEDREIKEVIRNYSNTTLTFKEKYTLAQVINYIEKILKGNKNG